MSGKWKREWIAKLIERAKRKELAKAKGLGVPYTVQVTLPYLVKPGP